MDIEGSKFLDGELDEGHTLAGCSLSKREGRQGQATPPWVLVLDREGRLFKADTHSELSNWRDWRSVISWTEPDKELRELRSFLQSLVLASTSRREEMVLADRDKSVPHLLELIPDAFSGIGNLIASLSKTTWPTPQSCPLPPTTLNYPTHLPSSPQKCGTDRLLKALLPPLHRPSHSLYCLSFYCPSPCSPSFRQPTEQTQQFHQSHQSTLMP